MLNTIINMATNTFTNQLSCNFSNWTKIIKVYKYLKTPHKQKKGNNLLDFTFFFSFYNNLALHAFSFLRAAKRIAICDMASISLLLAF